MAAPRPSATGGASHGAQPRRWFPSFVEALKVEVPSPGPEDVSARAHSDEPLVRDDGQMVHSLLEHAFEDRQHRVARVDGHDIATRHAVTGLSCSLPAARRSPRVTIPTQRPSASTSGYAL